MDDERENYEPSDFSLIEYPDNFVPKTEAGLSDQEKAYNACCTDDLATLSQLLDSGRVKKRASKGPITAEMLLTHAAAANNSVECLKALLSHGWPAEDSIEIADADFRTPLYATVRGIAVSAAKLLLEAGAEVTDRMVYNLYDSVSYAEILRGEGLEMMKAFARAGMAMPDEYGVCTPMWLLALDHDQVDIVDLLFDYMVSNADTSGSLDHFLYSSDTPDDTTFDSIIYPDAIFDLLLYSGSQDVRSRGIALGRSIWARQQSRAFKIIRYESEELHGCSNASLAVLGKKPDDCHTYYMVMALIYSLLTKCMPLVNELIGKGISCNWHSFMEMTPIHYVAANGDPSMLQRILQPDAGGNVHLKAMGHGCSSLDYYFNEGWDAQGVSFDPNIATLAMTAGNTPLHTLAATARVGRRDDHRIKRVRILLAAGADVNARNCNGETALSILECRDLEDRYHETTAGEIQALIQVIKDAGGTK